MKINPDTYGSILLSGSGNLKEYRLFYKKLKQRKPKDLDSVVSGFHEEVFNETDCLDCANCCKTTSPVFKETDIKRMAGFLKIKPSELVSRHLHLDEENDWVLNSAPCPFLGHDNYCLVYDARPAACREYPHTDSKRFYQLIEKTINNIQVCPAVVIISEKLLDYYKNKGKM